MALRADMPPQNPSSSTAIFPELDGPLLTSAERDPFASSTEENENRRGAVCSVLDVTRPFVNLPLIKSSELGYIGRCVSLHSPSLLENGELYNFVFKGYIYCVTPDAICLFHCRRYLREPFEEEREAAMIGSPEDNLAFHVVTTMNTEEREAFSAPQNDTGVIFPTAANTTTSGDSSSPRTTQRSHRHVPFHYNASSGRLENFEELHVEYDLHSERHSSAVAHSPLFEGVPSASGVSENPTSAAVSQGNFVSGGGSAEMRLQLKKVACVGPLPFISLLRTKICNLVFEDSDSDTDFPPLFMIPDNTLHDMVCLRMFVRRHLVLTSLGYNSSGISLKAYVSCLCQCPSIDDMLLQKVAKEELDYLLIVQKLLLRCPKGIGTTGLAVLSRPPPLPRRIRSHIPLGNPSYTWRLRLFILELLTLGLGVVALAVSTVAYFVDSEVFFVEPSLYAYCFLIPLCSILASILGAFHLFFAHSPLHVHHVYNGVHVVGNGISVILSALAVFFLIHLYFQIQDGNLVFENYTPIGANFLPCAAMNGVIVVSTLSEIILFLIFIKFFREVG